jgi:hypothetical protein
MIAIPGMLLYCARQPRRERLRDGLDLIAEVVTNGTTKSRLGGVRHVLSTCDSKRVETRHRDQRVAVQNPVVSFESADVDTTGTGRMFAWFEPRRSIWLQSNARIRHAPARSKRIL